VKRSWQLYVLLAVPVAMVSYALNFISRVVIVGIMAQLFNLYFGIVGKALSYLKGAYVIAGCRLPALSALPPRPRHP
jgi:ABC-type branched-subunit amino acid transport system permease subunit